MFPYSSCFRTLIATGKPQRLPTKFQQKLEIRTSYREVVVSSLHAVLSVKSHQEEAATADTPTTIKITPNNLATVMGSSNSSLPAATVIAIPRATKG
jgi:hypothetical protein